MATATQSTMTKQDFVKTQEYLALTERQRRWLDFVIETSNPNLATRRAYNTENDAYAAMLTAKLEASPRVIAAIDRFHQRSPREQFLRDLQRTIERSDGIAKIEALKLFSRVSGFVGDSEPATQKFAVGDVVRQSGTLYRVASVDASGRILEAVEV